MNSSKTGALLSYVIGAKICSKNNFSFLIIIEKTEFKLSINRGLSAFTQSLFTIKHTLSFSINIVNRFFGFFLKQNWRLIRTRI